MVAFVRQDALVIKLLPERSDELVAGDPDVYGYFDPMNRGTPMKGWLTITLPEARQYEDVRPLIEESIATLARDAKRQT